MVVLERVGAHSNEMLVAWILRYLSFVSSVYEDMNWYTLAFRI